VVRGATSLSWVTVALMADTGVLAAVRGAQVLFSPLSLVYLASLFGAVPEAARLLHRSHDLFQALVFGVSAVSAGAAVTLSVALLLLGDLIGPQALGPTWPVARLLILPVAAQTILTGLSMGPQVGLRALAAARRSLWSQLLQGGVILVGTAAGTAISGGQGAVIGIAAATALGSAWWWIGFFAENRKARSGWR
jgi:hypothetical protein